MTPRARLFSALVVLAALVLAVGVYVAVRPPSPTGSAPFPRSGPISTYPAAWGIYSSCPGFATQGNTTTLPLGQIDYPNSWNTTTVVTLGEVYQSIVASSAFMSASSGHGWVVYSWLFSQGGSGNMPPSSNDIVAYFILTGGTAPNGYLTAFYDIQNGEVQVGSVTATATVVCPTTTTSS